MYFKDRNWISKTLNCIICLVVCEIVFCSKFSDIPDNAEEREREEGEEEHRQLQSITRFTQTQLYKGKQTVILEQKVYLHFASKLWELIPSEIKSAKSLNKEKIKSWKTDKCPCRLYKTYVGNIGFI